jgi:recombinational DNA repair protein (RecF pathway)
MKQTVTRGIVLMRTDFQEADRIITVLTPDHGKVRLMAKGVRREKSKLAGGIELFSVSDVTFLPGRKEIGTLISSRLMTHYGLIVKDIQRTMLGYDLLKRINRITEDGAGEEYFALLDAILAGLNETKLKTELAELWFTAQLLKVTGHSPKLAVDTTDKPLRADQNYLFSFDDMAFQPTEDGLFSASHIKLFRLSMSLSTPLKLINVQGADTHIPEVLNLAQAMLKHHIRL